MQFLLDLPWWDATATNFSEYSDRTMNFYHCCCTCSKKRDFYPNKILHRGVCHMSRVKLQTSIWSKFWISSAYLETFMNFYLRLLLHLFTARFFCVLLLVLHFPMKVFAVHQSSMVIEAGTPDLSQCNNTKNEEFFDNFCEQCQVHGIKFLYQDISTNSVRLKNMSEFLVSSTINYFRCQTQPSQNILGLFCDHLPTAALLNLTHEFFNNKTYCQTHLKKVFQADAYALCDYLDFEKIIHHFAPYADYSFQSNTSVCLSSYKSWICSNHHELFCINSTSRFWDKQMPCSSFCHQTQAMCPFLRIGDKAKILGSTPVFLCEGLGDSDDIDTSSESCYDDFCDLECGKKSKTFNDKNSTGLALTLVSTNSSPKSRSFVLLSSVLTLASSLYCLFIDFLVCKLLFVKFSFTVCLHF